MKQAHQYILAITLFALATTAVITQAQPPQAQTTKPPNNNLKKVIQPNVVFYSKVFLDRDKTFISVPVKFSQQDSYIQLSMVTSNESTTPPVKILYHPILNKLEWPKLTDNQITLYQKESNFKSVNDFINNPPQDASILLDPSIVNQAEYAHINAEVLAPEIDLNSTDYILTDYQPPILKGGKYHLETFIDASSINPNDKNEIPWFIYIEDATEDNPVYLGEIHVDYR